MAIPMASCRIGFPWPQFARGKLQEPAVAALPLSGNGRRNCGRRLAVLQLASAITSPIAVKASVR